jgi:chemotaxis protein CheX
MVSTDDIYAITENVFTTMIESHLEIVEDSALTLDQSPITGCVQIAGQWTGAVMVQTTNELASKVACKMLALPDDTANFTDCQDSIAELTTMIGGNIKSLVPGPSILSLPSVTTGKNFDIRVFGTVTENSVCMSCDGQLLRVVLCRGEH